MSKRSKLSPDEAQEFSASLGKAAAGDWELMDFAINTLRVPEALGMDTGQWVESIGGYIRMGVEQRREAVRELDADGKSESQIATILGISAATVKRDRAVLKVSPDTETAAIGPAPVSPDTKKPKQSVEEQRPQIRAMIDAGKKDAEIALALDRGVATIQKERLAYLKEVKTSQVSKADQKAGAAAAERIGQQMKKGVTSALGISPVEGLEDAARDMRTVLDADTEIDFDRALFLWTQLGDDLWVYGARRGLDVSEVVQKIERMKGGDDA